LQGLLPACRNTRGNSASKWVLADSYKCYHVLVDFGLQPLAEIACNGWFNAVALIPLHLILTEKMLLFMMATHSSLQLGNSVFGHSSADYPPGVLGWTML